MMVVFMPRNRRWSLINCIASDSQSRMALYQFWDWGSALVGYFR